MIATDELEFTDLARQRRLRASLSEDLTPDHTVDQAVGHYLERVRTPRANVRWSAYSRGVRLDGKSRIAELSDEDKTWTVLPEVSAG